MPWLSGSYLAALVPCRSTSVQSRRCHLPHLLPLTHCCSLRCRQPSGPLPICDSHHHLPHHNMWPVFSTSLRAGACSAACPPPCPSVATCHTTCRFPGAAPSLCAYSAVYFQPAPVIATSHIHRFSFAPCTRRVRAMSPVFRAAWPLTSSPPSPRPVQDSRGVGDSLWQANRCCRLLASVCTHRLGPFAFAASACCCGMCCLTGPSQPVQITPTGKMVIF